MPLVEMNRSELEAYKPDREEPGDFDDFWARTLAEAREHPMEPRFNRYAAGLTTVDVFDVVFPGYGGDPIRAWLVLPAAAGDGGRRLPAVVSYVGYGGGRGLCHDHLVFASAGYAHLVMDTRGQGSSWSQGDTPDNTHGPVDPSFPGVMTRGIGSPETYYYRRLMTDAARAVEAVRAFPVVDPSRVVVHGGSQGGGLAIAAAGLADGVVGVMPDVPFLCHWRRAVEVASEAPYTELVRYCAVQRRHVDQVFTTLSYMDCVNHAARARGASALFSAALMDPICPPSTVFAAYHHYDGPKRISVWPFNQHEGGQGYQVTEQLEFLRGLVGGGIPPVGA
jgi:cephalosporin-C deacetylase